VKIVTVQIDDRDFRRLQQAQERPGFGQPLVGVHAVLVDGDWKPVTEKEPK